MRASRKDGRILIYSHDTFGLGHLRRCRAIAHALVERYKQLSVLILSGSPIIGSFDFKARVDFVRMPGVIKLRNGEYTSLNLHIDITETLKIRASIIRHTAEAVCLLESTGSPGADPYLRLRAEAEITGSWVRVLRYLVGEDEPELPRHA